MLADSACDNWCGAASAMLQVDSQQQQLEALCLLQPGTLPPTQQRHQSMQAAAAAASSMPTHASVGTAIAAKAAAASLVAHVQLLAVLRWIAEGMFGGTHPDSAAAAAAADHLAAMPSPAAAAAESGDAALAVAPPGAAGVGAARSAYPHADTAAGDGSSGAAQLMCRGGSGGSGGVSGAAVWAAQKPQWLLRLLDSWLLELVLGESMGHGAWPLM